MNYFLSHPSPFQQDVVEPKRKRTKTDEGLTVSDLELVVCCYSLLETDPDHFKSIWDWSAFIGKFSSHKDSEVRWIVCQCLALLGEMSETDKLRLVGQSISSEENRKFSLKYFIKVSEGKEGTQTSSSSIVRIYFYFLFIIY